MIVLAGGFLFGFTQMVSQGSMNVVMLGLGTIFTSASLSVTCWLIAEGIEVFMAIEENTRQSALTAVQAATTTPSKVEMQQMAATLASATRLLEQMATSQQQTNQRLDALGTGMDELRSGVGTGVRAIEAIAESSKVTATVLYRQVAKNN